MQEKNNALFKNLYVHFPYCETKCHYCDFFSLPEKNSSAESQKHIYSSILKELKLYQNSIGDLETIFLGGGTPSLAPLDFMEEFVLSIPNKHSLREFTIEANPSSIKKEKIQKWKSLGIHRVSMGMQALENQRLKWLGRVHDKDEIFQALDLFFEEGIKEVSVDYILGVPGQNEHTITNELASLLKQYPQIQHLSAYLLTLKPSNPLYKQLPNEQEQLNHLRTATKVLRSFDFEQYEVSNFCRKNKKALHNQNYWSAGGYLGIGPSAHSYWPQQKLRTKNWASLGRYKELLEEDKKPIELEDPLSDENLRVEYLMLGLRKSDGIDITTYNQLFNRDLLRERLFWIEQFVDKKLCKISDKSGIQNLALSEEGFYLSDQIISKII